MLRSNVKYVLVFTFSPWWQQYPSYGTHPSIHDNSRYPDGGMVTLNNGANADAMFTQSWGFTGYDLNFTVRTTNDCNGNGIVDATELSPATDCDANGVLDSCQQLPPGTSTLASGPVGPVGGNAVANITFPSVRPSSGTVDLTVTASADLSATHEFLFFRVGPGFERLLFTGAEQDCTTLTATVSMTREQFEAAIVDHQLHISISGSPTVDPAACGGQSWVSVQASYLDRWPDCNGNLGSDVQDFCSGTSADCNSNGRPDECDIALALSTDFDANGQPDECQPDCNRDGRPDAWQIATGQLVDCDLDGTPDTCELAAQPTLDCNSNGRLDTCDIASGTSPDCDADGRIDSCAIAQQLVPDCNGNGTPDGCDIASGTSLDCNANGKPDSCDLSPATVSLVTPRQAPFFGGVPLQYTISGPRRATTDVDLRIQYLGYSYAYWGQYFRPSIDGAEFGAWYDAYWGGCSSGTRTVTVPRDQWNAAASDGTIVLRVQQDSGSNCGDSSCIVTVTYVAEPISRDCNTNGIPDVCDLASGFEHDCDANGIPESCDIAGGAEDENGNGYQDDCELRRGDLNLDGRVDGTDLGLLLAWWGAADYPIGDLNGDGTIDGIDLGKLLSSWGAIG
ncbi:MAG: dockerin type I repeat-containing protein [Phycisphaerales bacterium]